jgi:hypothetical protein
MTTVLVAMIACAIHPLPRESPLTYREQVVVVLLCMKFLEVYARTDEDIARLLKMSI